MGYLDFLGDLLFVLQSAQLLFDRFLAFAQLLYLVHELRLFASLSGAAEVVDIQTDC